MCWHCQLHSRGLVLRVVHMRMQVSLSVRLAVGMTAAQVAAGTDVALAEWLAQPSTTQAVARMYAPDAVIRWLHTPEIWYQKVCQDSSETSHLSVCTGQHRCLKMFQGWGNSTVGAG